MAVVIKYIVERAGVEKMTFSSKTEADAYDRMLDIADELFLVLGQSTLLPDEQQREELSLYLAQHKEQLIQALGQKAKQTKAPAAEKAPAKQQEPAGLTVAAAADTQHQHDEEMAA